MINGHGADFHNYSNIKIDFSSNVYPDKTNPELKIFLKEKLDLIADYPEANAESLSKKLGDFYDFPPNSFLITNGAVEAFYLIAAAFANTNSSIIIPSFSEYEDACNIFKHKINLIENLNKKIINSDLIWMGNPNNPDGKVTVVTKILNLLENNPDTLFIIDEAYMDFIIPQQSVIQYIPDYKNLVVVRSFTKLFVLPGLRLGYICSNENIIGNLLKFKMPWSVNSLAIEAGKWILEKYDKIKPDIKTLIQNSQILQNEINNIDGLEVIFSECNFFLVKSLKMNSKDLKKKLIDDYGILIRDASNFKGLNEQYFRIASGTYDENLILINALKKIYE
jgi:threonine-phosphate decarboxylase